LTSVKITIYPVIMKLPRYLEPQIRADLVRKMVFLGGPRQCGKTSLAKHFLAKNEGYLNWDAEEDRDRILSKEFPVGNLWVFDEIHKYRGWRNYLKGLYDKKKSTQQILVTGSARLDLYRFGGDSLQGRYHYLRLHPLSLAEISKEGSKDQLHQLFMLGAFPEPLLGSSQIEANRWSLEYRKRLVREDISTLESLQDLVRVEMLLKTLPSRVGAPLSINSLREDLQVAHKTMAKWLDVLERVYSIFRLLPFGAPKLKAVKKEQKHYHYDWNLIEDEGARFENLVASHLLKWTQFIEDTQGRELELRYFRDITGREVDFVVIERNRPILFVESKLSESSVHPALQLLVERFPKVEAWQVHLRGKKDYLTPEGIRVAPAEKLLMKLI
jgi:predicted AAA+ superfamily ATPase